ncbi:hypothetical protein BQ8482_330162 [Mesorhizobium delmotii]|uniref:Uncharacterized protein n=1 Tax=Mesorhizobium delmotii TaxID=1631247 RepID=A0A2P9APE4_9HYPH|nr:hypothetical protein BQ8482_330162 [Mesorhizobium delmotii]
MSLDISVDANPTQAAMPKKAMCRMMDECAVVVTRRELNPCGTRREIFFGMQEPKAEIRKDPDCPDGRNDPVCHPESHMCPDCRHANRYHAPALAIGVSRWSSRCD